MRYRKVITNRIDSSRRCAFETLDERILLTASVVGRHIIYNGSAFDGSSELANAADDGAIALDKVALLPGQTATKDNVTDTALGINGIMIDIAGLPSSTTPTDLHNDLSFKFGNNGDPTSWDDAPAPTAITIRSGDGQNGSARITIVWSSGDITNGWLQVTVRANNETGLSIPDVFYVGNLGGDADGNFTVNNADYEIWHTAFANSPNNQTVASVADFDHNGTVDNGSDFVCWLNSCSAGGTFNTFTAPGATDPAIVGRHIFYNGSAFDGSSELANAADDGAIALDKVALLPGQTATKDNVTDTALGINGIMIDIAGLPSSTTPTDLHNDLSFKFGNNGDPTSWDDAPAPTAITIRSGDGQNGSARITIVWSSGDITNGWLQVTVRANNETGLSIPDVFYVGNLGGDADGNFTVNNADYEIWHTAFANSPNNQTVASVADFDHNGTVDNGSDFVCWLNSCSAGGTFNTFTAPGGGNSSSHLPQIIDFTFVEDRNVWSFSGEVVDNESVTDLTVTFGGLLAGYSTTVDSDGTFALLIPRVDGAFGSVTSVTVDRAGLASNVAVVFVN